MIVLSPFLPWRLVSKLIAENLESQYSPTQNAIVLVFARSVEADIERGFQSVLIKGTPVTLRLLVASNIVHCLKDKEGRVLFEIRELTGADIQVLVEELSLGHSLENVVQITGNYKSVQNAIFQVTSRLRDNLLPREVLNENRVSNCYGEVTETSPSQVLQPTSSILDNDNGPNLTQRLHTRHSENTSGPQPVKLQPQEATGNGKMVAIQGVHHSSTTSGGSFDLETSLDSLLPYVSPASDEETALTRAMGNIEFFDGPKVFGVGCGCRLLKDVAGDDKGCVEIVVHEDAFDSIYGKNDCNLARLKEISGAKVEVHEPCGGESEGRVLIYGTPDQTLIAQSLLQAFIQANQKA
ncbi:hypothetical protein Golax_005303 [Gossypium laxum]|uniref:K Homology domain-containing protein n=1 Tax=Gossypium laxum TaxID=34288 RepID=A0A7J9A1Q2_9ROSI|nr:hypothetical protein [Gossypium laxum]